MAIKRISLHSVVISSKTTWSLVCVEAEDGVIGIGEATLFKGATSFPALVQSYSDRLSGRPMDTLGEIEMDSGPPNIADRAVFSAIEQALWDLCAKRAGLPVYDLMGGARRDTIPIYANINRRTVDRAPAGFAESAALALRAGFSHLKAARLKHESWDSQKV